MPVIRHGKLNEPMPTEIIWRYLSVSKFRDLLTSKQLFMCRLDKFSLDPQDGQVPEPNYLPYAKRTMVNIELVLTGISPDGRITMENNSRKELVPLTEYHGVKDFEAAVEKEKVHDLHIRKSMFASCWHKNTDENLDFWRNYKDESIVAIKTTVGNLVNSVYRNREHLYISNVQYVNDGDEIPHQNGFYQASHKNKRFDFEKEVRLLYWCVQTAEYKRHPIEDYRIKVNLNELISEVWMSPYNSDKQLEEVRELLKTYGVAAELKKSKLANLQPIKA